MAYEAKILRHSVSEAGIELVTFEVNYPHAIHKDIMTHRWARNFQSFRAFPPEKVIAQIEADPFIPEKFDTRVVGMGQGEPHPDQALALAIWMRHVQDSLATARQLLELGLAKAQVNFPIQDLAFIRGIITTTLPQLENFFGLRLDTDEDGNPMARPEVHKIAAMMQEVYVASEPFELHDGDWHLPLVSDDEITGGSAPITIDWDYWKKVSVGRCARVSYLTHDGVRDPDKDVALHDSLMKNGHMSPFEHQGTPIVPPWSEEDPCKGSFAIGWRQYRKFIPCEANYSRRKVSA